ncbi:MAG TPA: DNA polymerase I [Bacteroidales bacterium]|nr:DNA polymerase I [Bacteroidales bacterium]
MFDQKKFFLLDAYALIYRAYYALNRNPRVNSKGLNTSAILGFANTLVDILSKEKPDYIGVVFDPAGGSFRNQMYPEYKANREAMPEDIRLSIPYIKQLIQAFNIPVIVVENYEADDVIGTLAKQAEKENLFTFMMTPDKDFGQLVSENIKMYKPPKMGNEAVIWGVKEVCEEFGIQRPEQVIDFLGLSGDASDNIPGISGVGPVTARKLLAQFGSVENLVERTHEIKNEKVREKVEAAKAEALLSKKLATIDINAPILLDLERLKSVSPNEKALRELTAELEFRTFAARVLKPTESVLPKPETSTTKPPSEGEQFDLFGSMNVEIESFPSDFKTLDNQEHQYELIDTPEKRKKLIETLSGCMAFAFDTETTGLDSNSDELVGLSFSYGHHSGFYIPLPENFAETEAVVQEFKDVFENESIGKIGQNLKFDLAFLKWYGIEVKGRLFDTMIAHYLLQADMRHGMDVLAEIYLKYKPMPIEALIGKKGKNQINMRQVPMELLKEYASEDADITLQLKDVFEPQLFEAKVLDLFNRVEIPLIPVLASMESEGVNLDVDALNAYSIELKQEIYRLNSLIQEMAGFPFNVSSPKQLGEVLFDRMKIIEKAKKTKTGQYSTGEDILLKMENKHPIIRAILDYRSLTKLKSTYVDALPLLVNPRTRRIHTSYNQTVTATGRLSSTNPNLQNIPIRTEKGREIRKAFVPRNPDFVLLAADYSQIELRIIASLSGDTAMLQAFRDGLDIHTATASKVYNVPLHEVSKEMRRNAKGVNFGIIYGISAFGLAENLGISRKEAAEIIDNYFSNYPSIKTYMDQSIALAKTKGYVETILGRRRYLNDINSSNAIVRGFAERNAINAPIQGSSADMIKVAMIRIYDRMQAKKMRSKMILQVHDELVFDAHRDEVEELKMLVEKEMREAIPLNVPIVVDMNIGENWLEAH